MEQDVISKRVFRKALFRARSVYIASSLSAVRVAYWRMQGMRVGCGTKLLGLQVTWPHKVSLGERCSLERGVYFNAAGPYSEGYGILLGDGCFVGTGCEFNISAQITVGKDCLIAAGTRFIDHNHGTAAELPIKDQPEMAGAITIGPDVWIGANSIVLMGVTLGEGAVVAAGSVVTHSVEPYDVVAGSPARVVRSRSSALPVGAELGPKAAGDLRESVRIYELQSSLRRAAEAVRALRSEQG